MKYYYVGGQQQIGPVTIEHLQQVAILPECLVWRNGLDQWVQANTLPELAILFIPTLPAIAYDKQHSQNPTGQVQQQPPQNLPNNSTSQGGYQQSTYEQEYRNKGNQGSFAEQAPYQVSGQGSNQDGFLNQGNTKSFERTRYATFFERLAAVWIDSFVTSIISYILAAIIGAVVFNTLGVDFLQSGDVFIILIVAFYGLIFICRLFYEAIMLSSPWRATLGKLAFGITVTDLHGGKLTFGHAFGRAAAKILSDFTCTIGYFMIFAGDKSQTMHDRISATLVRKNIK